MLASQQCVFDYRTDLNWQQVKKNPWNSSAVQNYLVYVKILICEALPCCRAICLMIWCMQSECAMS